jgi:cell division protein FtsI (penicillin-binding protein 3)
VAAEGASGGDIVVVDPRDGSILAMASSRRDPRSIEATALTEPFEPGSTIKPFIAASLLARGKASPDETVDTHGGTFELNGRTLTDEHKADRLALRDVIRLSSNIGIAEFAERLTEGEEYETLRDLGFGMPTGVPYPAESPGTLRRPIDWSKQSSASLAIGYELAVTPLQLAMAYASIANGGELLEPGLVREVRRSDGTVLYRHVRRAIRRVMPVTVADTVRAMLVETVAHGTGSKADLSTFAVAGKTGTARRTERNRGYVAGAYTATFVGLFPAANPQYVILVKINDPPARGESYFAAKAAAPVARTVLEAAVAARDASLDRGALAARKAAPAETTVVAAAADIASSVTVDLPLRPAHSAPTGAPRAVPDVHGMSLRAAVHVLHRAGFRVELIESAPGATIPVAGTVVPEGAIVKLGRL